MPVKVIHNEKDKSWLTKKNCIKKKNTHRRDKKNILKRVIKTRYFPWICIKLSLRWMKSHKKRTDDLLESVGWFYMLIPIFRLKEASLFLSWHFTSQRFFQVSNSNLIYNLPWVKITNIVLQGVVTYC